MIRHSHANTGKGDIKFYVFLDELDEFGCDAFDENDGNVFVTLSRTCKGNM